MRRILKVLVAGVAVVGALTPATSVASIAARPNSFTTKPSGSVNDTISFASRNWSGLVDTGDPAYGDATGDWTVPAATSCTAGGRIPACYSSAWVGIDGWTNASLIQTGTNQNFINASASYSAWWTTSAQGFAEQPIGSGDCLTNPNSNCGTVDAGDSMSAHIHHGSGQSWDITLADTTSGKGWVFTKTLTYTGPGDSAEWIMEAPTVGRHIATLPHYDLFDFHPVSANSAAPLADASGVELIQKGKIVSIPSDSDTDFDGFAMASYTSTQPSRPST